MNNNNYDKNKFRNEFELNLQKQKKNFQIYYQNKLNKINTQAMQSDNFIDKWIYNINLVINEIYNKIGNFKSYNDFINIFKDNDKLFFSILTLLFTFLIIISINNFLFTEDKN